MTVDKVKDPARSLCICCSTKPFQRCCEPFLNGTSNVKTPVQLMRSRYAAYAMGGNGRYLKETWLPDAAQNLSSVELSNKTVAWQGLEILDKTQKGDVAMVEFKALYLDKGKLLTHHEKSIFQRIKGQWYYARAQMLNNQQSDCLSQ